MPPIEEGKCPICSEPCQEETVRNGAYRQYNCPNCGHYIIPYSTSAFSGDLDDKARAVLSHNIWKNQHSPELFIVTSQLVNEAKDLSLPTPAEQLDLYILFMGDSQGDSRSKEIIRKTGELRAKIGALNTEDIYFIQEEAKQSSLFKDTVQSECDVGGVLTMKGWQRYEELKRGRTHSRTAFMAMQFTDPKDLGVVRIVDEVFRPAVKETGFDLKRIDDETPAGLIDNRLRVEIRRCRFLIADLTYNNNGAYWEAGYAEGLDKPVIYTCSKLWLEKHGTHFDTNHHHTIRWDPNHPDQIAESLKSTIRKTLPFEAKMPEE